MLGVGTSRPTTAGTSLAIRQGQWRKALYTEKFQTLAYLNEWPAASFMYGFLQGLVDYTKSMLVAYERPMSLDGAIELAIQLEWQVQAIWPGGS